MCIALGIVNVQTYHLSDLINMRTIKISSDVGLLGHTAGPCARTDWPWARSNP